MPANPIETVEANLTKARGLAQKLADEARTHWGERVRGLRLYGSAARGDWTPESDIDVLVLLDHVSDGDVRWLSQRAFEIGVLENGTVLQPLPMSERDFSSLLDRERRFALEVEREGIRL